MKVSELMAILAKCNPEFDVIMPDHMEIVHAEQDDLLEAVLLSDYVEDSEYRLQDDDGFFETLKQTGAYKG